MWNLKGVQGAIEEILDKARARGQTKVIDLSNSKKQAKFNEKILESKEKPQKRKEKDLTNREKGMDPKRTFNLPPGLKLQEIKCTQMHKDSHLYAYLVTTREGAAGPSLVFCNSIKAVRRVGTTLKLLGLPVRILHANMQQVSGFRTEQKGCIFNSSL
jgi:ATP-dependent RNA helicase DDX24/MAK5